jgi:hypothetical protein
MIWNLTNRITFYQEGIAEDAFYEVLEDFVLSFGNLAVTVI